MSAPAALTADARPDVEWDDILFVALAAVVCVVASVTMLIGGHSPVRSGGALAFLLLGPGSALVANSPVSGFYQRLLLSLALSLVLDVAFVSLLFLLHQWHPLPAYAAVAAAAAAACLARLALTVRSSWRE